MPTRVSDCCETHREHYPAREPNLAQSQDPDEQYQVGQSEGLFEFVFPPIDGITFGAPPSSDTDIHDCDRSKYLWVVALTTLPVALEHLTNGMALKRGRLTHTNITGGVDAHTAGELWFRDSRTVMINGASSRYTPRSPDELLSVAQAIKSATEAAGYGVVVASLGWDEGSNKPLRVQTERLTWV